MRSSVLGLVSVLSVLPVLAAPLVAGCATTRAAAARDPLKCERDPRCSSHERAFDCSAQCTDDPACLDRCNQVQSETGTSSPH